MAAAIEEQSSLDWAARWNSLGRGRGSAVGVGGRWGRRAGRGGAGAPGDEEAAPPRPVGGLAAPPRGEKGSE
jgi:hypothetical protein